MIDPILIYNFFFKFEISSPVDKGALNVFDATIELCGHKMKTTKFSTNHVFPIHPKTKTAK